VDSTTRILPLEFPFNSGRNYIMNPQPDLIALQSWIIELNISDVTQALLGNVSFLLVLSYNSQELIRTN
jgi:hypothetical protein